MMVVVVEEEEAMGVWGLRFTDQSPKESGTKLLVR